MSKIRDWTDVYVELKRRAEDMRGSVELHPGTVAATRWPRTTGADVVAIAAFVDPHVRSLRSTPVRRAWRMCTADVARYAIPAPGERYAENRAFWNCLLTACVHLASENARLPDAAIWHALVAELGNVLALRNVGPRGDGPFKNFPGVRTFDDLYVEQYKFLRDARGADEVAPDTDPSAVYGLGGAIYKIPRTTNTDVIQLADYWTKQLESVKRVMGHDAIAKRWNAARADVDALARKGEPNALYPKNNAFWRQLKSTAVHVAAADEAPTNWDLAFDSLKDSVKNLPDNIKASAHAVASGVQNLAGDIAHGVGRVANSAGKGLFSGMGMPLLVGGGLLGLFLISRARKSGETKER